MLLEHLSSLDPTGRARTNLQKAHNESRHYTQVQQSFDLYPSLRYSKSTGYSPTAGPPVSPGGLDPAPLLRQTASAS